MPRSFVYSSQTTPSVVLQNHTDHQSTLQRMRNFANTSRPSLDITIDGDGAAKYVPTFTTLDTIKGTVSVTAPADTKIDDVEIAFVGSTKTYVDRIGTVSAVNGRHEAFHPFLKLTQPIDASLYPESRTLEAGKTYNFPFTFVIPQCLLPQTCQHKLASTKLKDAHLQLPPSLGDVELAGTGSHLLSDMAPEMSKISYSIKARVLRKRDRDGKETIVSDKSKKIRIVPATEEQPPVDVDGTDQEICLRKEKSIRKGLFKNKLGRLVMEAEQPRSFRLPQPSDDENAAQAAAPAAATTMATVLLRFEPADQDAEPPRLGSLASKMKAVTFYSAIPRRDFPSKASAMYDSFQGVHIESVPLSDRKVTSTNWQYHEPHSRPAADSQIRRDSAFSISDAFDGPAPSEKYSTDKPFHTARLLVPISLPSNRTFVPTFHSCLVSRIYILDLTLNVSPASGGVSTSVTLKVPVQVSARARGSSAIDSLTNSPNQQLLDFDEEELEVDEFFAPRNIAPPPEQYLRTSSISASHRGSVAAPIPDPAPPEYSYFAPRGSVSVAS